MPSYRLPENLRKELKKPIGELITDDTKICEKYNEIDGTLITVGDVCTLKAISCGKMPFLAIIDFKTKRSEVPAHQNILRRVPPSYRRVKVKNSPGTISDELIKVIEAVFKNKIPSLIVIEGEEDLAVIPVIIHAPEDSWVVYGQPDEGAVFIKINKLLKENALKILDMMEVF